ncbi:sigma 54-interacting transcriptional regulator [Nitratidesulfovibrio liaohensis]|uniref:HTH-type transcriptional regulatory protein TyrR n=1 Tax=Nitratidesulfovibrio liaohensis TaxID=2604158 RepID=A0ABY9R1D5_9BACT|nr:sigma 54-interacting transcriptional regulator [Nitratidesulfovibrio liaohensis]WMW65561.1 sigma 54-interacting transcriptional regulator [Nitratidesulfovibrio liaohensis]
MEKILKNFRNIIDIFSDGIYISDRDGTTLLVNRMYEKLTGLRQDELRGRNVNALVEEGIFDRILNPEIVRSKRPSTSVQNVRGEKKIILRGYPVLDESGEVCLVVTFARDITMITQFRDQIAQQKQLIDEFHERLESMIQTGVSPAQPIFRSEAMLSLVARLQRVAGTDATLLLLGETGVGKDVLARLAHEHSPRSEHMFLKIDCGSIAPNLIESELFGYMAGAFSGANAKGKAGYFEMAEGGTVFLDEIGELPLPMQTKLLRVLQDQEVTRVGATQPRKVDVRIIAATNRDLGDDVRTGKFRSDLFYRLSVAVLQIPPLRERREDIAPLARHFLERYASKYRRSMEIAESTLEALENYSWPGNVREMQNFIQGMVVTGDRPTITCSDLPPHMAEECRPGLAYTMPEMLEPRALRDIMDEIEREILERAITRHGSVNKVARLFKVSRTTIFRKLREQPSGGEPDGLEGTGGADR